ncbi:hypothetical protein FRC10_005522 [Ceratobasidium sp. 414]|nr:hypothetical protein FRC10_005522 [Ceratobasidium sp. 414]
MLVSEATGPALNDSVYSLAHIRMLKYLARFLGLPAESSWEQVKDASKSMQYSLFCQSLIKSAGIQIILMDDGLANDKCFELSCHDQLTPFPNKRIVRIETLFESIVKESEYPITVFINAIDKYASDSRIAGFKSIAAYRGGLDVEYHPTDGQDERALVKEDITTGASDRYKVTKRETILTENVARGDIHPSDAIKIAKRMLFENSNKLYNLGLAYTELNPEPDPQMSTGLNNSIQPAMDDSPSTSLSSLVASLRSQNIKFIRLAWVDYVNLVRYRVIPIDHFVSVVGSQLVKTPASLPWEQLAESGISIVQAALGLAANDGLTPGVSTSGDHDLKPDLSSMWKPSYAPGHVYMMGRFFHKSHAGGAEFETCPRTILQRVVQRAEQDLGAKFLVGFETEFILLNRNGEPASKGAWSTSRKLLCGPVTDCVHEIAQTIIDAGIKLELYHAESADGQYEVVTGPQGPVQAVDALIATREIIYNVAQKHNLRATLCPRLYAHQAGTASHVHISVQSAHSDTPSNHPDIPDLPKDLASFMSGLLAHLPTVCAFTLPLDASYARVMDGVWSGGAWVCWGRENKETPLRLCGSGKGFNVELKAFDGLANPYLGLAAALAAGVTGLEKDKPLEMRDCRVVASELTAEKRGEMRISMMMPTQNIVFEPGVGGKTKFLKRWLPEDAWLLYKNVRKFERDNFYAEYRAHHSSYSGEPTPRDKFDFKSPSANYCKEHY